MMKITIVALVLSIVCLMPVSWQLDEKSPDCKSLKKSYRRNAPLGTAKPQEIQKESREIDTILDILRSGPITRPPQLSGGPIKRNRLYSNSRKDVCLDLPTGSLHEVGKTWNSDKECARFHCMAGREHAEILIQRCHNIKLQPGCKYRPGDENFKFPHCCPSYVCYATWEEFEIPVYAL